MNVKLMTDRLLLTENLDEPEIPALLPFCESSARSVTAMLKRAEYEDEPEVIFAAACDAYLNYLTAQSLRPDETAELQLGDISLNRRTPELIKAAENLRKNAFLAARPFLRDDAFAFFAV